MPQFIKDNIVLLIGLILPVLLMGIFFVAVHIQMPFWGPQNRVADLHYDIVFSTSERRAGVVTTAFVFVEKDTLNVRYTRVKDTDQGTEVKLYLYEAATHTLRPLTLPEPDTSTDADLEKNIVVASTADLTLSHNKVSPDGYEFKYGADYHPQGLINDLFIGSYSPINYGPRLYKNKDYFPLVVEEDQSPLKQSLNFIGWVVSKRTAP